MKIGHLEAKAPVQPAAGDRAAAAKPGKAGTEEASAQVELSAAATALSSDNADFDAEKVARIAQAIREGKFTINAEAIADKLIANAHDLLGKSAH